jgi:dihydrofolate reductase
MPDLVYFVATTVDGRIAAPDGGFDFFPQGDHLGAQVEALPETIPAHARQALGIDAAPRRFGSVVMGRNTYAVGLREGITDPYQPLETVVFSRTLDPAAAPVRITAEDPVAVVRELKQRATRDIWLCGGGALAGALAGVIDEVVVKVNPVLAGAGLPMVDGAFRARALVLGDVRRFESGVVWLTYRRAVG